MNSIEQYKNEDVFIDAFDNILNYKISEDIIYTLI